MGAELRQLAGNPVVETGADGDDEVRLVHGHVGLVGAVHPQHAEIVRVGGRHRAEPHECLGNGETGLLHQLAQLVGGIALDDAAATVDHRALGLYHEIHGLANLLGMPLLHRPVGTHADLLRIVVGNAHARIGDILGNVHQHRAGTPGGGDIERLGKGLRDILHPLDEKIVLHAGTGDAGDVHLLEGVAADEGGGHLAGEHHHGNGIHVGSGDAGYRVGGARPRGHQRNAGLARGPRIAISGMGSGLFVAHQDMTHLLLLKERIVDVQDGATGVTPDVLDTLIDKRLDDDFRATQFHCINLQNTSHQAPRFIGQRNISAAESKTS